MWYDTEGAKYGSKCVSPAIVAAGLMVASLKKKSMQANFLAFNQPDVKYVRVNSALLSTGYRS